MAPSFPRLQGGRRKKDVEPSRREKKKRGIVEGFGFGGHHCQVPLGSLPTAESHPIIHCLVVWDSSSKPHERQYTSRPYTTLAELRGPKSARLYPSLLQKRAPSTNTPKDKTTTGGTRVGEGGATPPSFQQRGNITGASAPKAGQRRRKSCQMDPICRPPPWAMFPPVCVCG